MDNLRVRRVPAPRNEVGLGYLPGQPETLALKAKLSELLGKPIEMAPVIDGHEVRTGQTIHVFPPHRTGHLLGKYHQAGEREIEGAISGSLRASRQWSRTPAVERAAVFLRAAELLSKKHRFLLNAATMLGQSKTCYQAEIDSACELIDFWRFNPYFQKQLSEIQPLSPPGMRNRLESRALEGFVFAVTPFNFTAIGGNLPTVCALMGNVVLWKPASTAVYSGFFIMKILEEAGLPPGVIQFLPGAGSEVGDSVLRHPDLAGIHFTGSTGVFQQMWKAIGDNISKYRTYPRIVGETGGKGFVFVHPSADIDVVATALLRGAFEYQGQKCSAASRAYIPKSLWPRIREKMVEEMRSMKMGDVTDFSNFMGAVINRKSVENIQGYLDHVRKSTDAKIVQGGKCHTETGYFVEPTLVETTNPKFRTMCEEIFGPVLTVYPYDDAKYEETLHVCDETSPYALTGSIFANDTAAIYLAASVLKHAAGNFYINNKPTGAVVGQQPFGGARGSGTNDKAGSLFNLMRWTSLRTVSETLEPPTDYRYPFMGEEEGN